MSTSASQDKRPLRNQELAVELYTEFNEMFSTEEQTKQKPADGGWSPYFTQSTQMILDGMEIRTFVPGSMVMEPLEPTGKKGYSGREWFWNEAYKHYLRDANEAVRKAVHDGMIIYGLDPHGATTFHEVIVKAVVNKGTTKVYREDIF